jgi:hypothetical protein
VRSIAPYGLVAEGVEHADDRFGCPFEYVNRSLDHGVARPALLYGLAYGLPHGRVEFPGEPEATCFVVELVQVDFQPAGCRLSVWFVPGITHYESGPGQVCLHCRGEPAKAIDLVGFEWPQPELVLSVHGVHGTARAAE